jgi:IS5 family transposase
MKPRERRETGEMDLFRSRLDQIINMNHELVRLAKTVSWERKRPVNYAMWCF